MKIRILGNGGAINDGLPYNSFIADDFLLVETPPDIMLSLFREKIDLTKIYVIFISHFHGDHYFGLPFLLLRIFFNRIFNPTESKIRIIGPVDIENKTKELCRFALGNEHPVHQWMEDKIIFTEISVGSIVDLGDEISLKIFSMYHLIETYGFAFYKSNNILFSYFADSVWNDELLNQIKLFPEIILIDMNGEISDPVKFHMSENDIIEKAIPFSEGRIIYYGTHLKTQKQSQHEEIKYVHPGEIILLK